MEYRFNKKLQTKNFTIEIAEEDRYGYFEHDRVGEDRAGGLWFEVLPSTDGTRKLSLTDYDGVFELPWEVTKALVAEGYDMSYVLEDLPTMIADGDGNLTINGHMLQYQGPITLDDDGQCDMLRLGRALRLAQLEGIIPADITHVLDNGGSPVAIAKGTPPAEDKQ